MAEVRIILEGEEIDEVVEVRNFVKQLGDKEKLKFKGFLEGIRLMSTERQGTQLMGGIK